MYGSNRDTHGHSATNRPVAAQAGYRPAYGGAKKHPVVILVLGPHGCGKSTFINKIIDKDECHTSSNSQLCTRGFRSCRFSKSVRGNDVKFIDSPGFGNEMLGDREIFESLVQYFAPDPTKPRYEGVNYPDRVTGVVYIHHEDKPFMNRSSQTTMEMLGKIIGDEFLNRLTVLIQSGNKSQWDLSNYTPPENSPLSPLYRNNNKPRTMPYDGNPQSIERILEYYTGLNPRLVRLAALDHFAPGGNWQYDEISRHLREFFPADIGPWADIQSQFRAQENKLDELRTVLAQWKEEIEDLRSTQEAKQNKLDELQNLLAQNEKEMKTLKFTYDTKQNELEALRNLFAQKAKEMEGLRSIHDTEQKHFRDERMREKFNHEVALRYLQNMIEEREAEILQLKSNKGSDIKNIETLNAEIINLGLEKDSEISRLRDELQAKNELLVKSEMMKNAEINKLSSEKDLELERLRDELHGKGDKADNKRRVQESIHEVGAKESKPMGLQSKVNGAAKTENKQEVDSEIDRLRAENSRINAEYASLRNHMQLEENTEQADITTALGDINRLIEEFGGSLSEHIENYMKQNPPEKAFQPEDILGVFGQVGGEMGSKVKQDAYALFEYAVQATMCDQLYTHLFRPFHPNIADDEKRNTFIMQLYEQMTYQVPQSVVGRWRRDAFNAISRDLLLGNQDNPNGERMHRLITGALSALLGKLVAIQPHDVLKEYDRALLKVIAKAEDLNRLLKGGVSILGDFQPTVFPFGEAFRPDYMSEVNSKPKKTKQPDTILATIELGLIKSNALGDGRKPEKTVLRRAVVVGLPK
ncbi:hypothetical protein B0J17DRAFT_718736 [Rhizoctonia solani]|nr:hypothetical protein B0J17DRAFT_718736 [Rhizoctonia solani]